MEAPGVLQEPHGPRRRRGERLIGRIVRNSVCVVLVLSALYGAWHVYSTRAQAIEAARQRLELRAQLYTERIADVSRDIEDDAAKLAKYPPIGGLRRALATPEGIDHADGSSADDWKRRLSILFRNTMLVSPHYTQVRLILPEDNWREVVRVDRRGDAILRVPEEALQQKGGEPYLRRVQELPETGTYFSRITYNRENGRREGPPTIRFIQPVRDHAGGLFGVIVINADYAAMMAHARPRVAPTFTVAAINSAGDYMLFSENDEPVLHFHDDPQFTPPPYAALRNDPDAEGEVVPVGERLAYLFRIPDGTLHPTLHLSVVTLIDRADALAPLTGLLVRHIGVSLLMALFAGAITYMLGAELSGRFRALAEELHRKSDRLTWMLRNAADGMITISGKGIIEDVNPAAEKTFGHSAAEMIGQPLAMLMEPEDAALHQGHVAASRVDIRGKRMGGNREIHGRHKSGRLVPLEIAVSRATLDGEVKFIGLVRDITRRKADEARVRELVEELRKSNEELEQFAYVASHDLKAPLRVIHNAAGWLAEDLAPHLDDDTRESLDLLQSRATRMDHLLTDLLEHSRIGRKGEAEQIVSGSAFVETLRALLDLPEGMRFEVEGPFEEVQLPLMPLKVVLLNLVGNAIKHHDRPEGRVRLTLEPREGAWEFTVEDDGPGIPPAYHDKVFRIFHTLKPRDEVEGSGMGLAMVRKHVEVAGGTIELISDGTRGTTFRLLWPHARKRPPGMGGSVADETAEVAA